MGTDLNVASLDQITYCGNQNKPVVTILMMPPAALLFQEEQSSVSTVITGQSQWL